MHSKTFKIHTFMFVKNTMLLYIVSESFWIEPSIKRTAYCLRTFDILSQNQSKKGNKNGTKKTELMQHTEAYTDSILNVICHCTNKNFYFLTWALFYHIFHVRQVQHINLNYLAHLTNLICVQIRKLYQFFNFLELTISIIF